MRPTSEFIMKSFLNSEKKHIIITGLRGIGKTTLLQELLAMLPVKESEIPGVVTFLVPDKCVILRDPIRKEEMKIGISVEGEGSAQSRMRPNSEGFQKLGVNVLKNAQKSIEDWAYIDEIGFLESNEEMFKDEIRRLFNKKQVLAVVRKQDLEFINEIKNREDVYLIDLDEERKKIGCIVMASGLGKRFGSNKLLASFNDLPLYQIAFDTTGKVPFEKRLVITRTEQVYQEALKQGIPAILHDYDDRNDAIKLGIEQMLDMDACVFCPCDQPMLKSESLKRLLETFVEVKKPIVRMKWNDKPGTPILFEKRYFRELMSLPSKKGGSYIVNQYLDDIEYVQVEEEIELKDVDTMDDLRYLEQYCR